MRYLVAVEREDEGGWLAEVRTLADQIEHRELPAKKLDITFVAA